jgi:hypothetical protein
MKDFEYGIWFGMFLGFFIGVMALYFVLTINGGC